GGGGGGGGHSNGTTGPEDLKRFCSEERSRLIKRLADELRLEETKLVLLKKLRHSQIHTTSHKENSQLRGPLERHGVPGGGPPPLMRGGQGTPARPLPQPPGKTSIMPPLLRGSQGSVVRAPPPLLLAPRPGAPSPRSMQQNAGMHVSAANKPSYSQHPALSMGGRGGAVSVATGSKSGLVVSPAGGMGGPQGPAGSLPSHQQPKGPAGMGGGVGGGGGGGGGGGVGGGGVLAESPASRQAAAKLALRKQLEKTLLEIPPPKPPAPELAFMPSAVNAEFIYLLGLEQAVTTLLQGNGKVRLLHVEPFACGHCGTDFTPRWARDRCGLVLCERCLAVGHKRALRAEHTERLKAAFLRALQQEQEIEQQFKQQQQQSSLTPGKGESVIHHRPTLKQSQPPMLQQRGPQVGVRGMGPPYSPAGSLLGGAAGMNMLYVRPGSMGVHKPPGSPSPADRQREYLLDMIPSRSLPKPGTPTPWK
ncbi:LOW QUALITY PROTEIN: transcriptional repressor p66-beta-like, partial [Lampetra planeri]